MQTSTERRKQTQALFSEIAAICAQHGITVPNQLTKAIFAYDQRHNGKVLASHRSTDYLIRRIMKDKNAGVNPKTYAVLQGFLAFVSEDPGRFEGLLDKTATTRSATTKPRKPKATKKRRTRKATEPMAPIPASAEVAAEQVVRETVGGVEPRTLHAYLWGKYGLEMAEQVADALSVLAGYAEISA